MKISTQTYILLGAVIGLGFYTLMSNLMQRPANIVIAIIYIAFLISFYRDRKGI